MHLRQLGDDMIFGERRKGRAGAELCQAQTLVGLAVVAGLIFTFDYQIWNLLEKTCYSYQLYFAYIQVLRSYSLEVIFNFSANFSNLF